MGMITMYPVWLRRKNTKYRFPFRKCARGGREEITPTPDTGAGENQRNCTVLAFALPLKMRSLLISTLLDVTSTPFRTWVLSATVETIVPLTMTSACLIRSLKLPG